MYLEERIEQLEKEIAELKKERKERKFKTPDQLAKLVHCSPAHIRNLANRGEIEVIRLGTSIRIPMDQFEHDCEDEEPGLSSMREAIFGKKVSNAG